MGKYLPEKRKTEDLWSVSLVDSGERVDTRQKVEKSFRACGGTEGNMKKCVAEFIGFNLGPGAVANCIGELKKLKKRDIVYGVMFMRGRVSVKMVNEIRVQGAANRRDIKIKKKKKK